MSEMQNNRRHQAQKELGLDNTEEELQIEQSIQKEELRQVTILFSATTILSAVFQPIK